MQVSVAMCTYNGAKYLDEQLASIAGQEMLPDELVICDDVSTDGTLQMLEQFASNAPFRTRIVRNAVNLGYSRNFAKAVELCSGEMIALSDQDDIWYPHKLARLREVLQADSRIEGVFSNGDIVDATSRPVGRTLWESFRFGAADQARFRSGDAVDVLLRKNAVTGMAFAFRSSSRRFLPGMPGSWIHDGWLALLIAIRSRLFACPERLVGYRLHDTQQVGTPMSLRGKLDWMRNRGFKAYVERVHDRNLDEYQRLALQFDDLSAYLLREGLAGDQVQAKVRAKAAHAHRGATALSLSKSRRWPIVLPHGGSYARFSPNGLRALFRDLLV